MISLAVVEENLKDTSDIKIIQKFKFNLHNKNITIGVIDITENIQPPPPAFTLVRKKAISLNYRDKGIINLADELIKSNNGAKYQAIGSDFSGCIYKINSADIGKFTVGDHIIPNCNYSQDETYGLTGIPTNSSSLALQILPIHKLIKLPDQFDVYHSSAFSINIQTSYSMIRKAHLKGDENILILGGSSNTGLSLIRSLRSKYKNVKIMVVTTNPSKSQQLLNLGADRVVFINRRELVDSKRIGHLFNKFKLLNTFDVVFDTFSDLHLMNFIHSLKLNGKYITCGFFNQHSVDTFQQVNGSRYKSFLVALIKNNISIIGNCLGITEDLESALGEYSYKDFELLIDSVHPLKDAKKFLERTYNDEDRFGKVILKLD